MSSHAVVYFSPVRFASFWQRPHFMAAALLKGGTQRVLWVDPYPTRLPKMSDLARPSDIPSKGERCLDGVEVVSPFSLPIEPLRLGEALNRALFRRHTLASIAVRLQDTPFSIGVGKPSPLAIDALRMLGRAPNCVGRFYDAMDDYSGFYTGVSSTAMRRWELAVLQECDWVQASATALCTRLSSNRRRARLCLNGIDLDVIRRAREATETRMPSPQAARPLTFGYVGTVGAWFDWEWTIALAKVLAERNAQITLLGPVFSRPPRQLPPNVEVRAPVAHFDALCEVARFDVGIIPFRATPLTEGVDPIKYYEYRSLGLPVLATPFGELRRKSDDALVLVEGHADLQGGVERVLAIHARGRQPMQADDWGWSMRFAPLNEWLASLERAVVHDTEGSHAACTLS